MNNFFFHGGSVLWLMLFLALVILFFTIKTIVDLFARKQQPAQIETGLNSILFWGAICAGLGIFGHFTGIFLAMKKVLQARGIAPSIVAEGYLMSFTTIIFGLVVFVIASILWFVLRWQFKKRFVFQD